MAKFKVGDKVRTDIHLADAHECGRFGIDQEKYWNDAATRTIKKIVCVENGTELYKISNDPLNFSWPEYALVSAEPRREFIVIHRSGNVMTAEHRVNRDVIKSAKATCAPSDTFDFDTGAKLAFDRLMGREEPKPEPKPAHRFKVGDRVETPKGTGTVVFVDIEPDEEKLLSYLVQGDNEWKTEVYVGFSNIHNVKDGKGKYWFAVDDLSPATAPEPPKFYTGKVVCISGEYGVGRIFTVKDGFFADRQYNCPEKPYKSVDDMNDRFLFGKFAEAKE